MPQRKSELLVRAYGLCYVHICNSLVLQITGRVHRHGQPRQSQAPTCLRLPTASPYCTTAPPSTQWRILHWELHAVSIKSLHGPVLPLTLHNGIDRAALLTQTAVNALGHINVVTSCPSAAVHTLLGFNGDGLRRANGLAKLTSNATLFSGGLPSKRVLSSETGRDWALLERVHDGISSESSISVLSTILVLDFDSWVDSRRSEKLLKQDVHAAEHLD